MFDKKRASVGGRDALIIYGLEDYSLRDTMECGQCFRYMRLCPSEDGFESDFAKENPGYTEYMTVAFGKLIFVGQRNDSELIFYGVTDEDFEKICVPYFALDTDYTAIREDIISRTDSQFLKNAAQAARGVRILRQEPWETVFSFIVSQNNNIPRIRKIIRAVCAAYGENLAVKYGLTSCPKKSSTCTGCDAKLDTGECSSCGACYTFPTAEQVLASPELLLPSHPGFRYKYLTDAAVKVSGKEVDIDDIISHASYPYTLESLKKITGVGDKVASCAALFAFGNLEAFPVDVWMKRAIDEYFGGYLDPLTLGSYAGVAQQYIFHYIRMLSSEK
jgi:N-glycosylase/DNA lyase